jgi:hypothetical protein
MYSSQKNVVLTKVPQTERCRHIVTRWTPSHLFLLLILSFISSSIEIGPVLAAVVELAAGLGTAVLLSAMAIKHDK